MGWKNSGKVVAVTPPSKPKKPGTYLLKMDESLDARVRSNAREMGLTVASWWRRAARLQLAWPDLIKLVNMLENRGEK